MILTCSQGWFFRICQGVGVWGGVGYRVQSNVGRRGFFMIIIIIIIEGLSLLQSIPPTTLQDRYIRVKGSGWGSGEE